MADHKRWFKMWCYKLSDPVFIRASMADKGRWASIALHLAEHGSNGKAEITAKSLAKLLQVSEKNLTKCLNKVPYVSYQQAETDNTNYVVSLEEWRKEQRDSNAYERVKRFRKHKNDTP